MKLADVLARRKFDRYVSIDERKEFVRLPQRVIEPVTIVHAIRACRDPKDDKLLELAVNGLAEHIVTGDADLLALNLFRDIQILTPAAFLRLHRNQA